MKRLHNLGDAHEIGPVVTIEALPHGRLVKAECAHGVVSSVRSDAMEGDPEVLHASDDVLARIVLRVHRDRIGCPCALAHEREWAGF